MNTLSTIIVLDGSKGSGKSTIGKEIIEHARKVNLGNFVLLSLDTIRRDLGLDVTPENNEIAFTQLLEKTKKYITEGKYVILDCGLVQDKLQRLESLVETLKDSRLIKVFLDGDYNILKERVRIRDKENGKVFNPETFDRIYRLMREKSFDGYTIFDTTKLTAIEIAKQVIFLLTMK